MESEVDESRIIDNGATPIDPPMSEHEKGAIEMIRRCFPNPFYTVYKIGSDKKNDTGLAWNLDFCLTKGRNDIIAILKLLGADTTLENLDERMRSAYAIFALDEEYHRGSLLYRDLRYRWLLVPDEVMKKLGVEGYRPYHYAFERLSVEIIPLSEASDDLKRYRREIEDPEFNRLIKD